MYSLTSIRCRTSLGLIAWTALTFLGITAAAKAAATDSPPQTEVAALGRQIFFDTNLSASGKMSCGTCHDPRYGYGPAPGQAIAMGGPDLKLSGTRAVPSIRYLRSTPPFSENHHFADGDVGPVGGFMWDGRVNSIRDQASLPLLAANEMANGSAVAVAAKLRNTKYAGELQRLFGKDLFSDPQRALDAACVALDAFQQTPAEFFPYTSRYDAFLRGEIELNEQEERGVEIFKDPAKGNCASCHLGTIRAGRPPAFNDYDYANVGVPRNPRIPANADPEYYDAGLSGPIREDLRDKKEYCGLFRAPTLRNVAVRDAFFHNGVFGTLQEVMAFYVERDLYPEKYYSRRADGTVHPYDDLPPGCPDNIDHDPPLDRKPGAAPALTQQEQDDVIAFLKTLTDSDVAQ
jgi:cytochrome c peroxidase